MVSERFADKLVALFQLRSAWREAVDAYASNQSAAGNQDVEESVLGLGEALDLPRVGRWAGYSAAFDEAEVWERINDPEATQESKNRAFAFALDKRQHNANAAHTALCRDIFGNPFQPITFTPAWRTSDVLLLARGIYEERAFDRMPILADALQDAGCDATQLLDHLRDTNATHVRGCWALDLVLEKE